MENKKESIYDNFRKMLVNEDYLDICKILKENFEKIKQMKDNIEELLNYFIENIYFNNNNPLITLSFYIQINDNISLFPSLIIEKCFINNEITSQKLILIFKSIYNSNNKENFQIPPLNIFINFCFKIPDIINNYFEYSFINKSLYYESLFSHFVLNIEIFSLEGLIQKIYILKLYSNLYNCILINNKINEKEIQLFLQLLYDNELLKDEFLKRYFQFNCLLNKETFNKILILYKKVKNVEKLGRIDKTIRKNNYFLSLILSCENEDLQKLFFKQIITLLKEKKSNILEEIELYDFYQIFFGIYFILEKYNKSFNHLEIFDSLLKIVFLVMEIVIDRNKKGIIQIFMSYLKEQMNKFLKDKKRDTVEEEEGEIIFNNEQRNLLSLEINYKNFNNNTFLFCETIENNFKYKFYKIILKEEYIIKQNKIENNNNIIKEKKENKTKYKSIKFQKKYGKFDKNKAKNDLLELEKKQKEKELNEDEIKIPLSFNLPSLLKINLEKKDDYSDLQKIKSPLYLKDVILGLNSEFKDRQELSLKILPSLIDSQPLDLEFFLKDLTLSLFKLGNSFDIENYDELSEIILVKLIKFNPNEMTKILCERFFSDDNCGLKFKFVILNVIDKAVNEISGYYIKNKKPKINYFHVYFLNVIFPLLNYLKKTKIDFLISFENFDLLLAKFIYLIANMINVSENHPLIYKALFESFDLFYAIINLKQLIEKKSHTLIESLNCYINVTLNFYNDTFINIYPEFAKNLKVEILFLDNLLEDKQLNDDLRLNILKTLNKYSIQSDKFREKFFGSFIINTNLYN